MNLIEMLLETHLIINFICKEKILNPYVKVKLFLGLKETFIIHFYLASF